MTSPVVGVAGLNAIIFASYGGILRAFESRRPPSSSLDSFVPSLSQVYIAGAGAGLACCLVSTPTEIVKIRAQLTSLPTSGEGSWRAVKEILMKRGLIGRLFLCFFVWRGLYVFSLLHIN